jgi:uncharacterized protein YigA (DUF484 family)
VSDELAQELARMALDLNEQPDVEQTAKRFLEYVQAAIGVSHASVVLVHRGGRLETLAATDGADRLQFASVLDISLRTPTTVVGALTLYDEAPNRFTEQDATRARLYADLAAVAIANARTEQTLWQAIETRKVIGQAQGILMERFELTSEQAFAVLRRYSQDSNIKLRSVAQKLISTRNLGENV